MSDEPKTHKVQIIVAVIGLVGVLGAAIVDRQTAGHSKAAEAGGVPGRESMRSVRETCEFQGFSGSSKYEKNTFFL